MTGDQLETLKKQYDEIANELRELQKEIQTITDDKTIKEKIKQAKELRDKANEKRKEIDDGIKEIEKGDNADDKIKAQEIKDTLDTTSTEIKTLYDSIILSLSSASAGNDDSDDSSTGTAPTENKNIFQKGWGWIKKQWKDVWTKDSWEKDKGTNILRTVGFAATGVGAVALAYKGIKKLFGGGKDKKDNEEGKDASKKKKKPFWDRRYGKALKWTAITAGGIFGINWLGKKLDLWGTDVDNPTDDESSEVKYEAFDKLPEEKKEIYNELGDKVDTLYESINKRELVAGYNDEISLDRTAREVKGGRLDYTGIIPFCLDNKYGSVQELLGSNHSILMALQKGVRGMLDWLKDAGGNVLKDFANHYLKQFGFQPLNLVGDALINKIEERAKGNAERQNEIKLFFRQGIRIERYFFEKKKQLEKELAENNGLGKTPEQIMSDDELYNNVIGNSQDFQNFLTGGIDAAIIVLKNHNLLDGNLGESTQKDVSEIDSQRDGITGDSNSDITKIIYNKKEKGETVNADEKQRLKQACLNMQQDIAKNITPALEHDSFRIITDLLKESEDTQIKKYINNGGLIDQIKNYGKIMADAGNNIDKLNDTELKELAGNLNNFLALKKEIILGARTIGNEDISLGFRLFQFIGGSLNQGREGLKKILNGKVLEGALDIVCAMPGTLLGAGGIVVTIGGVTYVFGGKAGRKIGVKIMATGGKMMGSTVYLPYLAGRKICRGTSSIYRQIKGIYTPPDLSDADVLKQFKQDIYNGRKTLSDATSDVVSNLSNSKRAEKLMKELGLSEALAQNELYIQKKLLDNIYDPDTLKELKKDQKLYKRAIKYYDSCSAVKEYLEGNTTDIDDLKNAIDEHEKEIAKLANRTPDKFSGTCSEKVRENSNLKNNFESERTKLENDVETKKAALENAEKQPGRSKAKKKAINNARQNLQNAENKLKQLDKLEKEIKLSMQNIESSGITGKALEKALADMLGDTEKIIQKLGSAYGNDLVDVMKDIKYLYNLVDNAKEADGRKIFNSIDDLLNQMNGKLIDDLRVKCPKLKIPARITNLADTLSDIKLRNAIGLVGDATDAIKTLLRLGSKLI